MDQKRDSYMYKDASNATNSYFPIPPRSTRHNPPSNPPNPTINQNYPNPTPSGGINRNNADRGWSNGQMPVGTQPRFLKNSNKFGN